MAVWKSKFIFDYVVPFSYILFYKHFIGFYFFQDVTKVQDFSLGWIVYIIVLNLHCIMMSIPFMSWTPHY